jgi:serine phosphatase RsbU (regulator of sigma subunit)
MPDEKDLFASDTDEDLFAAEVEDTEKSSENAWEMLIVDDETDVHQMTRMVLTNYTYEDKQLDIFSAYSAEQAKQLLVQHPNLALILLDVVMETNDAGLKFAEYVRDTVNNCFVRIVLRTGQPGYAPEKEIICKYDINDYTNKSELTAQRIFTLVTANLRAYSDIRLIESYRQNLEDKVAQRTVQLAKANQEITRLNEQLKSENLRMRAELEVSRQLQQMLLPQQEELKQIKDLEIAGFMLPADEVGGDYYDVLQQNGRIVCGIGDVTGHGLESGVLAIMVQAAVRALLANHETELVNFLNALNQTVYGNVQRMKSEKNLTFALLEYRENTLYLTGQHEQMIVVRQGGRIEQIDTLDLGFPIGLEEDITQLIAQIQLPLNPGDIVILYTDGITEAENLEKTQYGLERLCDVASRNWQRSAEDIKQAIVDNVQQYIGEQKIFDDMTLLIIKRKWHV